MYDLFFSLFFLFELGGWGGGGGVIWNNYVKLEFIIYLYFFVVYKYKVNISMGIKGIYFVYFVWL